MNKINPDPFTTRPDWSEGLTAASKQGRRRAAANPRGMQGCAAGR
jgi:gamma-glutamyltranspeptidase/glutathione hydrolase